MKNQITASEARIITASALEQMPDANLKKLYEEIRKAANRGQDSIIIDGGLSDYSISALESLGYEANRSTGGSLTKISWEK